MEGGRKGSKSCVCFGTLITSQERKEYRRLSILGHLAEKIVGREERPKKRQREAWDLIISMTRTQSTRPNVFRN